MGLFSFMKAKKFPNLYRNRTVDVVSIRFYAVYMTAFSEGGINLPLARAISSYITRGIYEGMHEKSQLDDMIPKED